MATKISLNSIRVDDTRAKYAAKSEKRKFGGFGTWMFGIGKKDNIFEYMGDYKTALAEAKKKAQEQGQYVVIVLT